MQEQTCIKLKRKISLKEWLINLRYKLGYYWQVIRVRLFKRCSLCNKREIHNFRDDYGLIRLCEDHIDEYLVCDCNLNRDERIRFYIMNHLPLGNIKDVPIRTDHILNRSATLEHLIEMIQKSDDYEITFIAEDETDSTSAIEFTDDYGTTYLITELI